MRAVVAWDCASEAYRERAYNEMAAEIERQKAVIDWVESWVSNPVGAYSTSALDGLFGMTRDKIAALRVPHGD